MLKRWFPLWTVVVAVSASVSMSGRFAGYHELFDVTVTGKGAPVLLVPGLATTGAVWDGTVARLKDRYELHVLTLAGFGGPEPVGTPFLPRVAEAIVEYVDENRLVAPVLVGHSLGGTVALAAASRAPAAFAGVVAVDGVPYLPALADPTATPVGLAERAAAIRELYASMTREQFDQQTGLALASMITSPDDVANARAWARRSDPAAVGVAVAEMMTTDGRRASACIDVPVLLIGALGSTPPALRETTRAAYRAQMANVPRATVVFAEEARHFVMLDDPAFFQRALETFLASLDGPSDSDASGRAR